MDWNAVVGRNVREHRHALGLSQEKLALEADVALRHIGMIEQGRQNATVAMLAKLAKALKVQPADLLKP